METPASKCLCAGCDTRLFKDDWKQIPLWRFLIVTRKRVVEKNLEMPSGDILEITEMPDACSLECVEEILETWPERRKTTPGRVPTPGRFLQIGDDYVLAWHQGQHDKAVDDANEFKRNAGWLVKDE